MRAELEACDQWEAQGQRIRVWPVVALPIPEFVIFSSAEVSPHWQIQRRSMAPRDNRHFGGGWHVRAFAPSAQPRACPVQPPTPLGQDHVNVLLSVQSSFPISICPASLLCVHIEQFPSGVCTISSNNPPPSASNPECPLSTHSPPCL
jgi:hypothetical protein